MCQHWHHSAWGHSVTVQCKTCVTRERLKAELLLGVELPHIPLHQVRWVTVQDASWADAADDHSQGAFLGWCNFTRTVEQPPVSFCFVLSHKSHCLKQKCSRTSAAETQIMSEALAEVEWIRGLFEEVDQSQF